MSATLPRATPETLLAALDAAPTDAARAALLAAASDELRRQLSLLLARREYQKIGTEPDEYAKFSRTLDDCTDDAASLALIEAAQRDPQRGAAWVSEWRWRLTATTDDWRRRYLAMCGGDGFSE